MFGRVAAFGVLVAGAAALLWAVFTAGVSTSSEVATTPPATTPPATTVPIVADGAAATGEADGPEPLEIPTPTPEPAFPVPDNYGPRMDLVDLDGWLNTDGPTQLSDFDGQVLLIEMWTFGCHNCQARIPYNQSYYEEFGDDNFEIIGVHAPEFAYEAEVPNIIDALNRYEIEWPIALDTEKQNFRVWQPGRTNFWPRTYVIDQNGDVRYDHIGEGRYEELRETIRFLLENPPDPAEAGIATVSS